MAGFVYIMSNPSFVAGRIKIGKSDRDPEEFRKAELSSTGVPEEFRVEYSAYVENHHDIERKVHRHFHAQRPNKKREFFTCSIMDGILAIQNFSGETLKHEDNYYAEYERLKREQEEEERQEKLRLEYEELARIRQEKLRLEYEELERKRQEAESERIKEEAARVEKLRLEKEEQERLKASLKTQIENLVNECRQLYEGVWSRKKIWIDEIIKEEIISYNNAMHTAYIRDQQWEKITIVRDKALGGAFDEDMGLPPFEENLSEIYAVFNNEANRLTVFSEASNADLISRLIQNIESQMEDPQYEVNRFKVQFRKRVRKKLKRFY